MGAAENCSNTNIPIKYIMITKTSPITKIVDAVVLVYQGRQDSMKNTICTVGVES